MSECLSGFKAEFFHICIFQNIKIDILCGIAKF
jgi:hypothetical protein